jgi:cell wall-associated NlpC family hydrolase
MSVSRLNMLLAAALLAAAFALLPVSANAATSSSSGGSSTQSSGAVTGGVSPNDPEFRPTGKAKLVNGMAIPPADAPPQVVNAINAANKIVGKPYKYGGGHALVEDSGYDCSGTVSYALRGAGLLTGSPLDSGSFMSWGKAGKGKWFTIYTNPGHAFVIIAGLRLDTSGNGGSGPRWRLESRSTRGYKARHPLGF